MSERRERIRRRTAAFWSGAKYSGVGLEFGITIALCAWLGHWAQTRWEFEPWGVLIGVIFGCISGVRRLIQIVHAESAQLKAKRSSSSGGAEVDEDLSADVAHSEDHDH